MSSDGEEDALEEYDSIVKPFRKDYKRSNTSI